MKTELMNMAYTSVGQKKSESLTENEPITSQISSGRSIHRAARTHGVQGHLTEFIRDRQFCMRLGLARLQSS